MTKIKKNLLSKKFLSLALLFLASAAAYLPLVKLFSYTHDDWYLMYAALVKGPFVFLNIFSEDRPLRALVMTPAYMVFGNNPLYYNLSAYFFRFLSSLGFLWTLQLLWTTKRKVTLWMALLFLIYPGFLSQSNGIDYQSQMVSLAAATFSLALTLKSIEARRIWMRVVFLALSALTAWLYLGLVEYFIGVEALRFLLIFTLVLRTQGNWLEKIRRTLLQSLPFLLTFLPFLLWRFFIFESTRGATDMGKQLSGFLSNPLSIGATWLIHLVHDVFNTLFLAWGVPLYQYAFWMPAKESLVGFGIAASVVALTLLILKKLDFEDTQQMEGTDWRIEAIWLGLATIIFGILPVTLVNRYVNFSDYSRYTIIASAGVVMFIIGSIHHLSKRHFKTIALSLLVFMSILTHHANNVKMVNDTKAWQEFWWQASWRIPQLEPGTTLVARYSAGAIKEDYFVWGPANLIYYPEKTDEKFVQPPIAASLMNKETILNILTGAEPKFRNRRSIHVSQNFSKILILTQPTSSSCLRVIDSEELEISSLDNSDLMQLAPYSKADQIVLDSPLHIPSEIIFGVEPAHGWCYIYQKATLARQRGDWELVAALDAEASKQGSVPKDPIEWMPFIQASAMLGDAERVQEIQSFIKKDAFVIQQACGILLGMELTPEIRSLTESIYCVAE